MHKFYYQNDIRRPYALSTAALRYAFDAWMENRTTGLGLSAEANFEMFVADQTGLGSSIAEDDKLKDMLAAVSFKKPELILRTSRDPNVGVMLGMDRAYMRSCFFGWYMVMCMTGVTRKVMVTRFLETHVRVVIYSDVRSVRSAEIAELYDDMKGTMVAVENLRGVLVTDDTDKDNGAVLHLPAEGTSTVLAAFRELLGKYKMLLAANAARFTYDEYAIAKHVLDNSEKYDKILNDQ